MVELFAAGAVEFDVVGGPADPEFVAAGGELADEVGQAAVVRVPARLGPQDRHRVAGDSLPGDEELGGLRAEEDEPGHVRSLGLGGEDRGVDGLSELVGRQDVQAAVADVGRDGEHRIEDPLDDRADALLAWPGGGRGRRWLRRGPG